MIRIEVLEDDYLFADNVKAFLTLEGFDVTLYRDGLRFLDQTDFKADLYVLDIEVPGANGYEAIAWIAQNAPNTPVIFTSAYTDIDAIKKSYALGCSDYIKKPYNLLELVLRIRKLLPFAAQGIVALDTHHRFDMHTKQLLPASSGDRLSKTQKELLYLFIKHKNQIVTYDQLMREVWGDAPVKINTIATHVKEIRKVLPQLLLDSLRAEGYRLTL